MNATKPENEKKTTLKRSDVRRVKGLVVATNLKAGEQRFKIQQDTAQP